MKKLRYLSLYFHGYLNNNDHELHSREELRNITHYSIFNSLIINENIINNNGFILYSIIIIYYYKIRTIIIHKWHDA